MIVIDASALVELLVSGTPRAAKVAKRLAGITEVHAPHLIDVEIASVLRSLEARASITASDATRAMTDLGALDLTRHAHDLLLPRIWQLRGNLTAYDACYVALAEALNLPLITCDKHLSAAPGHRATIELVG